MALGRLLVAVAIAVVGLAGCGSGVEETKLAPKKTVEVREDGYHPARVEIPTNGRVTWVNVSDGLATAQSPDVPEIVHDLRRLDARNLFDTHTLQPGEAQTVSFDTPGEYQYFSSFDTSMVGVIEVADAR
jgi:plastocyanin